MNYLFENKQKFGSDFEYWLGDNVTETRRDMLPFSTCVELNNFSNMLSIGTNDAIYIILMDPNRYVKHRILKNSMLQDISMDSINDGKIKFDTFFTVKTVVSKYRPEKKDCLEYENVNGFDKCVEVFFLLQNYPASLTFFCKFINLL